MTTISDNFAGTLSNWTGENGSADTDGSGNFRVVSGSFTNVIYSHNTSLSSADQYIKLVTGTADTQYPILVFRFTNASSPFYLLYLDGNAGTADWYYFANAADSGTSIATGVSYGGLWDSTGDSIGVTIEGTGTSTVIRMWHNVTANAPTNTTTWDGGAADGSFTTDPSTAVNTGNKVGIGGTQGSANTLKFSDFWAGDFAAAGRTTKNTRSNPLGTEVGMGFRIH